MPKPPGGPPPDPNSVRGRRAEHRRHLAALYADIPPKRRAAFMRRAQEVLTRIIEDAEPDDTRYDEKGRVARLGTSKRDRAAIVRDALASMKTLGEISRDATEQHIAVTRLLSGILNPQDRKGDAGAVPLEDLSTLKQTVEHNECPPLSPAPTVPNSSDGVSKTSDDSRG